MVADRDTNVVYFSSLLGTRYPEEFTRISAILEKHDIEYRLLEATRDIWCRDYMPVQIENDRFIQFNYSPSYLVGYEESRSEPAIVLKANGLSAEFSNIKLDGGNVIKSHDKAILTERVFKENPQLSPTGLTGRLETLFQAEIFFVPDITTDMTGHADGHLRFIDSNTLLVNEPKNELKYWVKGFETMVKKANLDFKEIASFEYRPKGKRESAIGYYVNYLEIADLILFPIFGVPGNRDTEAVDVIKNVFPDRIIETININNIALEGGLMNCISWNIKTLQSTSDENQFFPASKFSGQDNSIHSQ